MNVRREGEPVSLGIFGGDAWYETARFDLYAVANALLTFPQGREYERYFLLAIVRRTLSLEMSFLQCIESRNGQMAMTLIRLNLDTLARLYALYWADDTEGMSAESFARDVAGGVQIRNMRLHGSNEKATDRWLIKKIETLAEWIPDVYKKTSGAIHFSDFHVNELMRQVRLKERLKDGSLLTELTLGPTDSTAPSESYFEVRQAFLHITLMLIEAIRHRCKTACDFG